jgi:hypothetical protein
MQNKWMLKAVVQKVISFMPQKERLNYFFQKHITKAVHLTDQHFAWKIGHACDHIAFYTGSNGVVSRENAAVLELGTGWYPIVPLAFYLSGFNDFKSIDIYNWMTRKSFITTVAKFEEWKKDGRLKRHVPDLNELRWRQVMEMTKDEKVDRDQICTAIGLSNYLMDARNTEFASGSFDFITSNNTFEHIPKVVLVDILKEFKRLLKPNGMMSHFVDLSDHFAHFEATITDYNFLKYSEKAWQRIDNSIQPQNRLRWSDYLGLYAALDIPVEEQKVRPGNLDDLSKVKCAAQFNAYSPEDLAITHGYLLSRMMGM